MKQRSVWQLVLLFERRLLFREFRDAVEAGGDHKHLLFLFRIGDHFVRARGLPWHAQARELHHIEQRQFAYPSEHTLGLYVSVIAAWANTSSAGATYS